jgi:O-antigen ligase
MSTRRVALTSRPAGPVVLAALLAATLVGALSAADLPLALGLLLGVLYAQITLTNLTVGIALWIPLVFIAHLPVVGIAPNAAALLIVVAWIGTAAARRARARVLVRRHRRLLTTTILLLVWFTLSLAWSEKPGLGGKEIWEWWAAALLFFVIATTASRERDIRLVLGAFVLGAVLSAAIGLLNGGLHPAASAIESATETEGRLQGGGGDPNYLAAGLVPGIVLAGGLLAGRLRPAARVALVAGVPVIVVGLAATESRGGLLAGVVTTAAALVYMKGRRGYVAVFVALVVGAGSIWFATSPGAWHRITHFNGGGSGRSDLWDTAWRISKDNPFRGVGLNNFRVIAPRYVQHPGTLTSVKLIAEQPRVVHNTYLQAWTETGLVGLALFLAVLVGSLRTMALAARRFDEVDDRALATLSRSVLLACLGILVASFFLSNGPDQRLWLLLGLGPALLALAHRRPPGWRPE